MRVNRLSQIAHNGSHFNSQHGFRDQFTGAGANDPATEQSSSLGIYEPFG